MSPSARHRMVEEEDLNAQCAPPLTYRAAVLASPVEILQAVDVSLARDKKKGTVLGLFLFSCIQMGGS